MKLPFYLYPNIFPVIVDLDHNNRVIQVMYQRTLKLQKGVKNRLQLQIKNSDQKLLNVSSSTFVLSVYDTINQRNLLEKPVTILDDGSTLQLKGLAQVDFTEGDMDLCDVGFYNVGLKVLDSDGSFTPAFVNTYYGAAGTLEVRHDLYPTVIASQEVTEFQMYYNADAIAQQYEYYSGNLPADPQFNSNQALHTTAVYMTNYRGRVLVEATLENSPMSFGNYAVISDKTYEEFSGIDYTNFYGVFSNVRIRYIPAKNPVTDLNNDTEYAGTVDKALYRS
jgi:hypothetical protein